MTAAVGAPFRSEAAAFRGMVWRGGPVARPVATEVTAVAVRTLRSRRLLAAVATVFAGGVALAVFGPAWAQAPGGGPPGRPPALPGGPSPHGAGANTPPVGPRGAEARRAELAKAFEALRTAPDEAGATLVEGRIRQLWASAATPSVSLLMNRGMRNMQANQPGDALEDFDAALTLAPEFPEAWLLRAEAHSRTGDPVAAARDLQEALRLEPRHWIALLSLATLQDEAGDPAAALRSVEAALAINPKMPGGDTRLRDIRRKAEGEAL